MRTLLYLHGFNSSPKSFKAQRLLAYMEARGCASRLCLPQIPVNPGEAARFLDSLASDILEKSALSVMGSSLGGYYATWLAEKHHCPAVLINPSVEPYETLRAYLGENRFYYEDGSWYFDESHIGQLLAMKPALPLHTGLYRVLLQTGDETLDYRQALTYYRGADIVVEEGGSHGFDGFENHLASLLEHCRVSCPHP